MDSCHKPDVFMTLAFVQGRYNEWVQGTSLRLPYPVGGEPSVRSGPEVIMICLCSKWYPLVATSRVGLLCTLGYIYAVVDMLYLWWLRPAVSAVCMLKMSSHLGHPFAAHTITCTMQPIRLTVATTNSLYMITDDYKAAGCHWVTAPNSWLPVSCVSVSYAVL